MGACGVVDLFYIKHHNKHIILFSGISINIYILNLFIFTILSDLNLCPSYLFYSFPACVFTLSLEAAGRRGRRFPHHAPARKGEIFWVSCAMGDLYINMFPNEQCKKGYCLGCRIILLPRFMMFCGDNNDNKKLQECNQRLFVAQMGIYLVPQKPHHCVVHEITIAHNSIWFSNPATTS